ncbi:MarR family transcriptional regulator [Alkalilimnicola ehrlichii]|uniref:MarR family transcriptional regulator n=1 Tax=Alkalilimnicola ehrlichii TaxID=351052 RepID=A0A3E0WKD6_9GAMM|nr:metalloregulator ArsR/SmtB family transcription factor [Alkalilimnicola ehrlichii]RFA25545.1 MarR family transcriptional regulator [Alkalilimnicola ehrlichii]RFA32601.1 MarR family transcriptional regulator [Alkalilimnicola ehrlichii]
MPSKGFENTAPPSRPVGDRLLTLLKTRGAQSASELGRHIGSSSENARQQLIKLAAEGLVEARPERQGVGRPTAVWRLTDAGHQRFPDAHAELTVQLIDSVRETLGASALERLVNAREQETLATYRAELKGLNSLRERVARLAELRAREGYMAEWRESEDGSLLFIENHCPICAAAKACKGFCSAELNVFRAVLGSEVQVSRTEHILAGERRCTYRIEPKQQKD